MCSANSHVRFTPNSGHVRRNVGCPLCANSGHADQKRTKHIRQKIKPVTRKNQGLLQDCRQSSGYGKRTASIGATNWPARQSRA
jgi:hypothetical protein